MKKEGYWYEMYFLRKPLFFYYKRSAIQYEHECPEKFVPSVFTVSEWDTSRSVSIMACGQHYANVFSDVFYFALLYIAHSDQYIFLLGIDCEYCFSENAFYTLSTSSGNGKAMKIGLILSGGMAKGAYQVGALRAIGEYLNPKDIRYISAASIGIMNAIAFSGGKLDYAEQQWLSINQVSDKIFLPSLYKSKFFQNIISDVSKINPDCEKIYTPILNLLKREVVYPNLLQKSARDRALYIQAAVAFPPFSKAVHIHGQAYFDGALVDNIPFHPLLSCDLDLIICIYFDDSNYIFESEEFTRRIIKIPFAESNKIVSASLWFTKQGIADMIRDSYQKTSHILGCVFSNGTDDPERIRANIRGMNELNHGKKVWLTGDMVVNNMNHLLGRFAKRKIVD